MTIDSQIRLWLLNTQHLSRINYQKVLYLSNSVREKDVFKTENDWQKQFYFNSIAKSMDRTVFRSLIFSNRREKSKKTKKLKPEKGGLITLDDDLKVNSQKVEPGKKQIWTVDPQDCFQNTPNSTTPILPQRYYHTTVFLIKWYFLKKWKIWDEQRKLQSGLCYLSILSGRDERLYLTYHPGYEKVTAEPKKSPDCFTQEGFRINPGRSLAENVI